MKYLLLLLACVSVMADTNVYDLKLLGARDSAESPGKIEFDFEAMTTNIRERNAGEFLVFYVSSDSGFSNPLSTQTTPYEYVGGEVQLRTTFLFPETVGDGQWFVRMRYRDGQNFPNVIANGAGPGDGYTYSRQVQVDSSYEQPVLRLPTAPDEPYANDILLLQWNLSYSIESYFLEISDHEDFLRDTGIKTFGIYLTHADEGRMTFDLSVFNEGAVFFRIRGLLPNGDNTVWSRSTLLYEKPTATDFFFPWLVDNVRGDTLVTVDIGDSVESVEVAFGVRPNGGDDYGSEIFWRTQMVHPGRIFRKNISELMLLAPEYIHQSVLNIKSQVPVYVTVHQHISATGDMEDIRNIVKTTDRLEPGASTRMVIQEFELDEWHTPSIVIGNFDQSDYHEREYANIEWVLEWNDEFGARRELRGSENVPPQANTVLMFTPSNYPTLPKSMYGTMTITNKSPNIDVAAYYSLSNNPDNGSQLFNFVMAKQIQ